MSSYLCPTWHPPIHPHGSDATWRCHNGRHQLRPSRASAVMALQHVPADIHSQCGLGHDPHFIKQIKQVVVIHVMDRARIDHFVVARGRGMPSCMPRHSILYATSHLLLPHNSNLTEVIFIQRNYYGCYHINQMGTRFAPR